MAASLSEPSSNDGSGSDSDDSFSSKAGKRCLRVTTYDPLHPPPEVLILHAAYFDLNTAERGFCLDSATQAVLTNNKKAAKLLGTFQRVRGAHGGTKAAEDADVAITAVTAEGKPVLLTGFSSGLYMDDANGNLLPLAPLVQAGITPRFKVGTKANPRDGGYLKLTDGQRIPLLFEKEMWSLPTWKQAMGKGKSTPATPQHVSVARNVYEVLDNEVVDEEHCNVPDLPFRDEDDPDVEDRQLQARLNHGDILLKQIHERVKLEVSKWCHPGPTKQREIMDYYPHLFPASRDFRRLFLEYVSPVDALMKGHCRYSKTARKKKLKAIKDKKLTDRSKRRAAHRQAAHDVAELVDVPLDNEEEEFDFTNPSDSSFQSFLAENGTLHEDDVLYSFQQDLAADGYDLHLDHAFSIAVGIHKEKVYLVMAVGGVDFLFVALSIYKSTPEVYVEHFLRLTRLKIRRIRIDDASELAHSATFRAWAESRGITLCPSPGYQHTFQARAEGAVRICKEHVCCIMKEANVPFRFWPYALQHFCCIFNHWPLGQHKLPAWERIGVHDFAVDLLREMHPFGCHVIGHLAREHPDVTDTTNSDSGLEGAFLGWHLTTPSFYMWSFRKRKVVRLSDPTFFDSSFPFRDPTCLVNPSVTGAEIKAMHDADGADETLCEESGESDNGAAGETDRQEVSTDASVSALRDDVLEPDVENMEAQPSPSTILEPDVDAAPQPQPRRSAWIRDQLLTLTQPAVIDPAVRAEEAAPVMKTPPTLSPLAY
eukprot:130627-Rhodomonas_salina.3